MRQIKLLIKACSVPHLIEGYSGDGIPNKTKYIEKLVDILFQGYTISYATVCSYIKNIES